MVRYGRSLSLAALVFFPSLLRAQQRDTAAVRDSAVELAPIIVTATREPRQVFATPVPVTVIDSTTLRRQTVDNAAELFYQEPGLDATGVGPNQARPVIRGQLGQRVLLLENGLRLNNSRRQSDFGELPSLVAVEDLSRVEVVRGPASVLYGTDALGGVINLITTGLPGGGSSPTVHGTVGVRYSESGEFARPWASTSGRMGRVSFNAFGAWRDASAYDAPSGRFGQIDATQSLRVHDTGVNDQSLAFELGYRLTDRSETWVRYQRYDADRAGFGYVDNSAINRTDLPSIRIFYPNQQVDRFTGGYRARGVGLPVADRIDISGWYQSNDRALNTDIFVPFGPGTPPGAGIAVSSRNHTDVNSWGVRLEAARAPSARTLITYGVDAFRDRSLNDDSTSTSVVGFGPPPTTISTRPQLPYSTFRSLGTFAQLDWHPTWRLNLIGGVRYQTVTARTRPTPGDTLPVTSSTDGTVVGALNAAYRVADQLSLVGSLSRGFRSPNLIERFFEGTAEGTYQRRNPNLDPETSLNADLGVRYRSHRFDAEVFVFQNRIHDGIRPVATGDTISGQPVFVNVNVDRLRYRGVEASLAVRLVGGVSAAGSYAYIDANDQRVPANPIAGSYRDKVMGSLRYDHPGGRFWAAYEVRHNGEQKDVSLVLSPVGSVWPGFTVQAVRAGAVLFRAGGTAHRMGVAVENLGNTLYSEPTNATLFRPAPGRNVQLTYQVDF